MTASYGSGVWRLLLPALLTFLPASASADLSFVQIVQGQTSRGSDGIFGKTWVEVRGNKMRLVSGYARKVRKGKKDKDPRRVIQIIDVDKGQRILLYPERKAFARTPLKDIDYGNEIRESLDRGRPAWRIVSRDITLTKLDDTRKLLGTYVFHYRINVRMTLKGPGEREGGARMVQHVWVAPVTGRLAQNVLDLIAFENAYRKKAGGLLSPLDHERYQVREAAAYLRVAVWDLRPVVESVRERLRELPSYPVASSVSWWRDAESDKPRSVALGDVKPRRPKTKRPRRKRYRPPVRSRLFKSINWRRSEKKINKMYSRTRSQFPFGPIRRRRAVRRVSRRSTREAVHERVLPVAKASRRTWRPEPAVYSKFEKELQSVLRLLIKEQEDSFAELPKHKPAQAPKSDPKEEAVPFYEIYTELYGLETASHLKASDFALPKGCKEVPYKEKYP